MAGNEYTSKKIILKSENSGVKEYLIPYVPNASATAVGLVKPDGSTITIDSNGVISASATPITVDSSLSDTSTNPVQNKVIKGALDGKQSSLNTNQLNAANSGITSTKVNAYDTHTGNTGIHVTADEKSAWNGKQAALSEDQLKAVNSGIDADKISTYDGYASQIAGKMDQVTLGKVATSNSYTDLDNKPSIPTVTNTYSATSTNAMSGKAVASAISGKADASSLKAVATSGSYNDLDDKPSIPTVTDTYSATGTDAVSGKAVASAISGKQNSLSAGQLNAANSGITSTKVGNYDDHLADTTAHITASERTAWNGKQGALTDAQMNAANSGITAEKVNTYDGYASTIAGKANSATTLAGYGITNAYTKDEVDGKLTSVYKYKGSVAKKSNLPTSGQVTGDVYNVEEDGMNYAWDGAKWDALGMTIDLTPYAKSADLKAVATSGSYNDLDDKPTIPSAVTEATVSGWGFTKATGTYSKPTGGIPKTDLADAVQTSLGKADSALQGITSSDVTTALGFTPYNSTNPTGYTSNKGTITGATMNGSSVTATNGVLALGTVITAHQDISGKSDVGHKHSASDITSGLSAVATSNSYNDLDDKPTIPSAVTETTVSGWGFTKNAGTVTKVNNVAPVNGNVTISIPTVTDTYSSTSGNAMSGKAVASAISGKADSSALSSYVPTTRTVNSKALSANITLTAADVGALTEATMITALTNLKTQLDNAAK